MHIAITRGFGHLPIVEALLNHNPSCAARPVDNRSTLPLHLASGQKFFGDTVVKLIFDAHPDAILIRDSDGDTPLDIVKRRGGNSHFAAKFLEQQFAYI